MTNIYPDTPDIDESAKSRRIAADVGMKWVGIPSDELCSPELENHDLATRPHRVWFPQKERAIAELAEPGEVILDGCGADELLLFPRTEDQRRRLDAVVAEEPSSRLATWWKLMCRCSRRFARDQRADRWLKYFTMSRCVHDADVLDAVTSGVRGDIRRLHPYQGAAVVQAGLSTKPGVAPDWPLPKYGARRSFRRLPHRIRWSVLGGEYSDLNVRGMIAQRAVIADLLASPVVPKAGLESELSGSASKVVESQGHWASGRAREVWDGLGVVAFGIAVGCE